MHAVSAHADYSRLLAVYHLKQLLQRLFLCSRDNIFTYASAVMRKCPSRKVVIMCLCMNKANNQHVHAYMPTVPYICQ